MRLIGYARVSTRDQNGLSALSGHGYTVAIQIGFIQRSNKKHAAAKRVNPPVRNIVLIQLNY